MKHKNLFFMLVFVLLWGALIAWNLTTPTQTFSQSENRTLAQFPTFSVDSLLDGRYMQAVDTWLNDQFAGRSMWVSSQTMVEYALGRREINNIYIGRKALTENLAPADDARTASNITGINDFAAQYAIPSAVALVPSAATVQPQSLPALGSCWDEVSYINGVYSQLSADVLAVPVHEALVAHKDEYIYYRTDHHWTGLGAYTAYCQLAPALGLQAAPTAQCEITLLSADFRGTYHSRTGYPFVTPDNMFLYQHGRATGYSVFNGIAWTDYDSIYFDSFLTVKDQYSYFLGQVQPFARIETAAQSGKRLLVFKDSYAHSLLPLLLDDYSEICIVDLRFTKGYDAAKLDALLDFASFDQALFLYSTDVFSHQPITSSLATSGSAANAAA